MTLLAAIFNCYALTCNGLAGIPKYRKNDNWRSKSYTHLPVAQMTQQFGPVRRQLPASFSLFCVLGKNALSFYTEASLIWKFCLQNIGNFV